MFSKSELDYYFFCQNYLVTRYLRNPSAHIFFRLEDVITRLTITDILTNYISPNVAYCDHSK